MDADPSIRAGEEVAIMRNGKIAGVGVAMMGGRRWWRCAAVRP